MRHFFSRKAISNISMLNARVFSSYSRHVATTIGSNPSSHSPGFYQSKFPIHNYTKCNSHFGRYIHTAQQGNLTDSETSPESESESEPESETDAAMNEFLSRFVWIMRRKVKESYPDCDKNTIEGMLLVIVEKVVSEMEKGGLEKMVGSSVSTPSQDLSDDLWKTVWEVSNTVLQDMEKEKKKEKMKGYLQSEEVKEMYRFASEIGIRGDMLRELRFKWAREKMEESEFYQNLDQLRKEKPKIGEKEQNGDSEGNEEKSFALPKRQGKIKYKIYGLDLSDSKWAEVADKVQESSEALWPQEAKPIDGKCRIVTDKILSLKEGEDFAPVLREWISLLQPERIDWISLLDRLKERDHGLYLKIAEFLLDEASFRATTSDYSKLIDAHSKKNRSEEVERILTKMDQNALPPDVLTSTTLVNMYSKSGDLEKAEAAFKNLKARNFNPSLQVYTSMITAYVNARKPREGEKLIREMDNRNIKPTKEIYMTLLRSFSESGDASDITRIAGTMQYAGFEPSLDYYTLLVEAFGQVGNSDQARENFDYAVKFGLGPDDKLTATMVEAYEKNKLLGQALALLLELEKKGFEPGVETNSVLISWLGKMGLAYEAEQVLDKISELGENPPLRVHVSLCEMYSRGKIEKKALQQLGVLESRKEDLKAEEFERVIDSLLAGGFVQDAKRMQEVMKSRGFVASDRLKVAMMGAHQMFGRGRSTLR